MIEETKIFNEIFNQNVWGSNQSVSGPGSTLEATKILRTKLRYTFSLLGIRTLVDAPCGDMNWMRHIDYNFAKFIGIDIVQVLIENLRKESFPAHYHFQVNNIITDILPVADAVFCRDCLVHLPFNSISSVQSLWKSAGFKYAFVTTFPNHLVNVDCAIGHWRPLNMEVAPFYWRKPLFLLNEASPDPNIPYSDKSIGVWGL
jgi:hypothetical protein